MNDHVHIDRIRSLPGVAVWQRPVVVLDLTNMLAQTDHFVAKYPNHG